MSKRAAILPVCLLLVIAAGTASADVCAPAKVADLAVLSVGYKSVALTWTDPGDDCNTGTASSYEVRYSTAGAITEANYYSASVLATGGPAGANGTADCVDSVNLLACNTGYYFAITFTDAAGNRSPVSNSPNGTLPSCGSHQIATCP